MKAKIFDDMNAGPFKAKVDERYHKLGQDCSEDGWVTGYLLRDLHKGEVLPHIFNCPCTWIVKEETIEPVGFHIAQWFKIEDRLPEVDEYVLCATKGGKYMINSMYIPKDCKGKVLGPKEWRGSSSAKDSITHWMPIVPPKED
jgi:hypothetical protein